MKTHFDPYDDGGENGPPEIAACGTIIGDEYRDTGNWKKVDYEKCLKSKKRLQKGFEETEKEIIRQMGDMADFMENEYGKEEET